MTSVSQALPARGLLAAVLVLLAVVACAGPVATVGPSVPPAPSSSASSSAVAPVVTDAWVRPPIGPDRPAGGYLTITGGATADVLVGASSPAAAMVEVHETTTDASGMHGMHPIPRLEIAPGAKVPLEPGGYHLMLMDVTDPLVPGETVELTLIFETAGRVTVQAQIREG